MIIMSVDYGDVRTGIAICDRLETLAYPVTVITESYEPKLITKICDIIKLNTNIISMRCDNRLNMVVIK